MNEDWKKVHITPIGGVNEVGNSAILIWVFIDQNKMKRRALLLDCGANPSAGDSTEHELETRLRKIEGWNAIQDIDIIITHAHLDHIGAALSIANRRKIKVHLPKDALYFLKKMAFVAEAPMPETNVFKEGDEIKLGPFTVFPFSLDHSIPGSFGVRVNVHGKNIVNTGDGKLTGVSEATREPNLEKLRKVGDAGVDLMITDMLYFDRKGISPPELPVIMTLRDLINKRPKGRHFIVMQASNLKRIINLWTALYRDGVSVRFEGRAMHETGHILTQMLRESSDTFKMTLLDPDDDSQKTTVIFCTGSQGEEFSFFARLAAKSAPIDIERGDRIYLSSCLIPNEDPATYKAKIAMLRSCITNCHIQGAEIFVHKGQADLLNAKNFVREATLHVSGHEFRDGKKMMVQAVRPARVMVSHLPNADIREIQKFLGDQTQVLDIKNNQTFIL